MQKYLLAGFAILSMPLFAGQAVAGGQKLPTKAEILSSFVEKVSTREATAAPACDPTKVVQDDDGNYVHVKCDDTAGYHLSEMVGDVSAAGAAHVVYRIHHGGSHDMNLTFDTGSWALDGRDKKIAQVFADALNDGRVKAQRFEIAGYTDEQGTPDYNVHLSQQRAESAKDYLVQLGVEADRLDAKGYGELHGGPTKNRAHRRVLARVLD